jgi:hypothetical protein
MTQSTASNSKPSGTVSTLTESARNNTQAPARDWRTSIVSLGNPGHKATPRYTLQSASVTGQFDRADQQNIAMMNNLWSIGIATGLFWLLYSVGILSLSVDLWDGSIVSHAMEQDYHAVLTNWFFESRWHFQAFLYIGIAYLGGLTTTVKIASLVACLLAAWELRRLTQYVFSEDRISGVFSSCVFLTFPIWHLLSSTVMLMHVVALWALLLGARKYLDGKTLWERLLAAAIFIVSFQLHSNIFLFAWIGVVTLMLKIRAEGLRAGFRNTAASDGPFFIGLGALFAIYFLLVKPFGLYAGYNEVDLAANLPRLLSVQSWMLFAAPLGWLSNHVLTLIWLLLLLYVLDRRGLEHRVSSYRLAVSAVLLLGLVTGIVPYLAVGKHPYFDDFAGWSFRQALPVAITFSILLGGIAEALLARRRNGAFRSWILALFLAYLGYSSYLSLVGLQGKARATALKVSLAQQFRKALPANGVVLLRSSPQHISMVFYDVNHVLYLASGERKWSGDSMFPNQSVVNMASQAIERAAKLSIHDVYLTKYMIGNIDYNQSGITVYDISNFPSGRWDLCSWRIAITGNQDAQTCAGIYEVKVSQRTSHAGNYLQAR